MEYASLAARLPITYADFDKVDICVGRSSVPKLPQHATRISSHHPGLTWASTSSAQLTCSALRDSRAGWWSRCQPPRQIGPFVSQVLTPVPDADGAWSCRSDKSDPSADGCSDAARQQDAINFPR
jgi:hypothetical protein